MFVAVFVRLSSHYLYRIVRIIIMKCPGHHHAIDKELGGF